MSEYTKRLAEQRQNIWEQAKGLLDKADTEKRSLSAEEQVSYDKMSNDLTDLRSQIDKVAEVESANKAAEESLRKLDVPASGDGSPADKIETGLRSFLKGETRSFAIPASETRSSLGRTERRALTEGTNSAGGYTVPTTFYDQLIDYLVDTSSVLQAGPTVLNTTSGEPITIPKVLTHGGAAAVAEVGTLAGTDPTFGTATLNAYKYGQIVKVSRELVDDSAFDLASFIAKVAGQNVGLALAPLLITGTGTNQPNGLVTAASSGVTGSTVAGGASVIGAPTTDNLLDLMYSVISPYRARGSWLMKDATVGAVRKFKDTTGQYLWQPSIQADAPDRLFNRPVFTDPNVAGIGSAAKSVIFGDISTYYVRFAGGVRFERSDEFLFDSDQVAFRAILRADGDLIDLTGSVKYLTGGTA